jgi:hypothetical protein
LWIMGLSGNKVRDSGQMPKHTISAVAAHPAQVIMAATPGGLLMDSATLSYAHGTSATPLLGETIGENLRAAVERFPEREALVVRSQNYRATYRQLWDETTRLARSFLALGVRPGDRVGIWATNRFEWVVAQYASARAGAILVNINPSYLAAELEYALCKSGVSVLLHGHGFRGNAYGPMLDSVRAQCPDLLRVFRLDEDWESLLRQGEGVSGEELRRRESSLQFDDPINIQYTSGTTGFPKGATLTHHNLVNNGFFIGQGLGYSEHDRVCIPVPFYHCFGMVLGNLACTSHGACMVVPGESFQARAVLETVQAERCNSLYGVPTMFRPRRCGVRALRPLLAAHRHHGGRPLSHRVDAPGGGPAAHGGGGDRLRHDRDIADLDAQRPRRPAGAAREHGRPGGAAHRDQRPRLSHGRRPAAGHGRRVLHARPHGHARLLERRGCDQGRDRPGGLDALGRPGGDGGGGLRPHRRPAQGHDHPRRREHLPA